MLRYGLPLLLFVIVIAFLAVGLNRDPRLVPSPLIGKPLPAFSLQTLHDPATRVDQNTFRGDAFLLNVWASWCVACRQEHPLLLEMAAASKVTIIGLNYKDAPDDANQWLTQRGDPYRTSIADPEGHLGLDLGVYGVPETFLIDAEGIIRYKHVGPLNRDVLDGELQTMIDRYRSHP